ncbi:hypothetical protein AHAS_Ahas17G0193000 [Arachis hypogaea]
MRKDKKIQDPHGNRWTKKLEVVVAKENLNWLQKSLIDGTTTAIDFGLLQNLVAKNFPQVVQVRELGAYKALLTFDSLLNAEETLGTSGFNVLVKEVGQEVYSAQCTLKKKTEEDVVCVRRNNVTSRVPDADDTMSHDLTKLIGYGDQAASVVTERVRHEKEDEGRSVISESILNEWSNDHLKLNQNNSGKNKQIYGNINGLADLMGMGESNETDLELTIPWSYTCDQIGLEAAGRAGSLQGMHHEAVGRVRLIQEMKPAISVPTAPLGEPRVLETNSENLGKREGGGCRVLHDAGEEARCNAGRLGAGVLGEWNGAECDEVEGCNASVGGKTSSRRLNDDEVALVLAGCASGRRGIAGERKSAGGDKVAWSGAYRLEEHAGMAEGAVTSPEEVQGDEEVNGHSNNDYHEAAAGGNANSGKPGFGIDSASDRNVPMQNVEEEYNVRGNHKGEQGEANEDADSSNECASLAEQMLENQKTWELAKESGAMLLNEEEDIMAILQEQNEEIARKRRLEKQKAKVRRSRPKMIIGWIC